MYTHLNSGRNSKKMRGRTGLLKLYPTCKMGILLLPDNMELFNTLFANQIALTSWATPLLIESKSILLKASTISKITSSLSSVKWIAITLNHPYNHWTSIGNRNFCPNLPSSKIIVKKMIGILDILPSLISLSIKWWIIFSGYFLILLLFSPSCWHSEIGLKIYLVSASMKIQRDHSRFLILIACLKIFRNNWGVSNPWSRKGIEK